MSSTRREWSTSCRACLSDTERQRFEQENRAQQGRSGEQYSARLERPLLSY